MKLLLSNNSDDGGSESKPAATNPPQPIAAPDVAAAPPSSAPPKTAATVIKGTETEDTIRLQRENEELKRTVKQREQEHASVRDEFKRYKDATEARRDKPEDVPVKKETKRPLIIGRFVG